MFLRTSLGIAMRATGDNVQMIRVLGINMIVFGLAISNGVALAGALPAQYQGFTNVGMGIGVDTQLGDSFDHGARWDARWPLRLHRRHPFRHLQPLERVNRYLLV
jgi:hypothetical protein